MLTGDLVLNLVCLGLGLLLGRVAEVVQATWLGEPRLAERLAFPAGLLAALLTFLAMCMVLGMREVGLLPLGVGVVGGYAFSSQARSRAAP